MSWPSDGRPRYVVGVTEGHLQARTGHHQRGVPLNVTAHVLDRAFCHRVVFQARSEEHMLVRGTQDFLSNKDRRRLVIERAEARAAELNSR